MATVSPSFTEKSISRKIDKGSAFSPTILLTWLTEIIATDMHTPLIIRHYFNCLAVGLFSRGFASLLTGLFVMWISVVTAFAQNETHRASKPEKIILIVGDSLSAEYGLPRGTGWVQAMVKQANQESVPLKVINASISGDTTSGGTTRLPQLLKTHGADIVVIELGGNDALRGLSLNMTQNNLKSMAQESRKAGAQVLLVAMQVPPNYGRNYRRQMDTAYSQVAKETGAQLNTTFLKGVADDADPLKWFQADRIHPNEQAQILMMKNIWPQLKKMLLSL